MLTIKLVRNDRTQRLWQGYDVEATMWAEDAALDGKPGGRLVRPRFRVGFTDEHGAAHFLSEHGTVFVMNDTGSTVATYFLGDAPMAGQPKARQPEGVAGVPTL